MAESEQRKVVIAMDGSDHSNYAFDWYLQHFRKSDDFVIIIHCPEYTAMLKSEFLGEFLVPNYTKVAGLTPQAATFAAGPLSIESNMAAALEEESKRIHKMVHQLEEKLKVAQIAGKVKTVHGKPGEAVLQAAVEEHADLIVTGTRGMGTVRRTFLGSVSDYIIHHSHIPVAICRHNEHH